MSDINKFSLSRSLRLVGMELRMKYQRLLIFSGALFAFIVLLMVVGGYSKTNYEVSQYAGGFFYMFFMLLMLIYLFYFHYTMNRRIRQSDTIAYYSIPVSNGERFLSILILGGIYFLLAWLVAQLILSTLILINPTVLLAEVTPFGDDDLVNVVAGTAFYNPKVFFIALFDSFLPWVFLNYFLYFTISQKSFWGWNSTTWWEKLVIIGLVLFFLLTLRSESQALKPVFEVAYCMIAVGLFIASYFRLKFMQQV